MAAYTGGRDKQGIKLYQWIFLPLEKSQGQKAPFPVLPTPVLRPRRTSPSAHCAARRKAEGASAHPDLKNARTSPHFHTRKRNLHAKLLLMSNRAQAMPTAHWKRPSEPSLRSAFGTSSHIKMFMNDLISSDQSSSATNWLYARLLRRPFSDLSKYLPETNVWY